MIFHISFLNYLIIYIPRYYLVFPSYHYKIMLILMHSGIPLLVPPQWISICNPINLQEVSRIAGFCTIFAQIFLGRTPRPPFQYNQDRLSTIHTILHKNMHLSKREVPRGVRNSKVRRQDKYRRDWSRH